MKGKQPHQLSVHHSSSYAAARNVNKTEKLNIEESKNVQLPVHLLIIESGSSKIRALMIFIASHGN